MRSSTDHAFFYPLAVQDAQEEWAEWAAEKQAELDLDSLDAFVERNPDATRIAQKGGCSIWRASQDDGVASAFCDNCRSEAVTAGQCSVCG